MPLHVRTARLDLSPLDAADLAAFVAYRRDPAVAAMQSWSPDYGRADALRLVADQPSTDLPPAGRWLQLGVHRRADRLLLGDVAVHRIADQPDTFEVGVTFAPQHQGHGYATEAVRAVIDVLFDRGRAHRVVANCDARNGAVAALLRRVGLRHESHQSEADYFKGEWTSVDGYAVLAREWAPGLPGRSGGGGPGS